MPFQVNPQLSMSYQPSPGPLQQMGQIMTLADMMSQAKMRQYTMAEQERQRAANLALGQQFGQHLIGQTGQPQKIQAIQAGLGQPTAPAQTVPGTTTATAPVPQPVDYNISDEDKSAAGDIFTKYGFDEGMKSWNMLIGEKTKRFELQQKATELGKTTEDVAHLHAETQIQNQTIEKNNTVAVAQQLNALDPGDKQTYDLIRQDAQSKGLNLPPEYDPKVVKNFIAKGMDLQQQHANMVSEKELFQKTQTWNADKFMKWSEARAKLGQELAPYKQSRDAWGRLDETYKSSVKDPSGSNDIAMLVNFIRLTNPSQTRMQTDAAISAGAEMGSFGGNIQAWANNLKSGQLLDQPVRDKIHRTGQTLYGVLQKSSSITKDEYIKKASEAGIEDPESITRGIWEGEEKETVSASEHSDANEALKWAQNNPNTPEAKEILKRLKK